jgi:hypothetical protein
VYQAMVDLATYVHDYIAEPESRPWRNEAGCQIPGAADLKGCCSVFRTGLKNFTPRQCDV